MIDDEKKRDYVMDAAHTDTCVGIVNVNELRNEVHTENRPEAVCARL